MRIIKQSHEIIDMGGNVLEKIEMAGRTCYKSESSITEESARDFVEMIIRRGHESVIEHHNITVKFITDRGITHELVRHRLASFSQESTRYVNYGGKDMEFILPIEFYNPRNHSSFIAEQHITWYRSIEEAEKTYNRMIDLKAAPQLARSVLPNSLKTEIVVTANLREWRHIFKLRCSKAAHPQIRALMIGLLKELNVKIPSVFKDIYNEYCLE